MVSAYELCCFDFLIVVIFGVFESESFFLGIELAQQMDQIILEKLQVNCDLRQQYCFKI